MSDPELARLALAETALAGVADRYDGVVAAGDGGELWRHAVADVQAGHGDDRPLYWARLKLRRQAEAQAGRAERASRGLGFECPKGELWLLLTGFDPFRLDRNLDQSNPAGLAVLALHGTRIAGVRVAGAILPVRFADFDVGIVEAALTVPFQRRPVLGITVSMGRDGFDLERFPGRRRSAAALDNCDQSSGGTAERPVAPAGLDGPEFLEFSLPADAMAALPGHWPVRDNRRVATLADGEVMAQSLAELEGHTAVAGSGGGFLSNEVAYRSLLLQQRLGVNFPLGHVHVPAVVGYDAEAEHATVAQLRHLIAAAVAAVGRENGRQRTIAGVT